MCEYDSRLLEIGVPTLHPLKRDKPCVTVVVEQFERIEHRYIPVSHHPVNNLLVLDHRVFDMHILHPRADQRIGFCRGLMEIAVGMVQVPENPARFGVYPAHKRFHRPAIRQHSRCFDQNADILPLRIIAKLVIERFGLE